MTPTELTRSPLSTVRSGLIQFIESLLYANEGWGRWKYQALMERPFGLISSALAIRILDMLGALNEIDARRKSEAVAFLQSCQDPADGWFKDPLIAETDKEGHHSWPDIWGQMGAAAQALRLLGSEPRYPAPAQAFGDLAVLNPAEWAASFDWSNPSHVGERFSRSITAYSGTHGGPGFAPASGPDARATHPKPSTQAWEAALERVEPAFAYVEQNVLDPATGMPTRGGCPDPSVAMAGLFKTYMGYKDAGRPYPYPCEAIDSTLALRHPDGDWGMRGNMCIVWDALWVLREMSMQIGYTHRLEEIQAAGNLTAQHLISTYRRADGGFAFGPNGLANHHSIRLSRKNPPGGDLLGTLMCVHCLRYAEEWNEL